MEGPLGVVGPGLMPPLASLNPALTRRPKLRFQNTLFALRVEVWNALRTSPEVCLEQSD